jgi:putative flippase GtrA
MAVARIDAGVIMRRAGFTFVKAWISKSGRPADHPARQLSLFFLAGVVGFAVDSGLLSLEVHLLHMDVYLARVISFAAAVTVTWLLNRRLAFRSARSPREGRGREYGRYLAVQIVGSLVNLAVFSALVAAFRLLHSLPIVPLAIGALFGLVVNYVGSRYWVFRERMEREA